MKKVKLFLLLNIFMIPNIKTTSFDKLLSGAGMAGSATAFFYFMDIYRTNQDSYQRLKKICRETNIAQSARDKALLKSLLCIVNGVISYKLFAKS